MDHRRGNLEGQNRLRVFAVEALSHHLNRIAILRLGNRVWWVCGPFLWMADVRMVGHSLVGVAQRFRAFEGIREGYGKLRALQGVKAEVVSPQVTPGVARSAAGAE